MICNKCKEDKQLTAFSKKIAAKNIMQSACKSCQSKYSKQHYIDNKASRIKRKLKREADIRKWLLEIKSQPCADCWISYHPTCMDFDHKEDKLFNIAEAVSLGVGKNKILVEISKCDLVCANCHRLRTYYRRQKS